MRKQRDRLENALPRILEGYCNKSPQPREVAEQEAKEFLQILEDSAEYQFGFNHSTGYSMIGYYCAWLRYYYPTEFVTAYLNNANKDEDIANGTALANQLGIKISPITHGFSKGKYSCNAKEKTIYKGLASIKYLNETIPDELNACKADNFLDLLLQIKNNTSVNSRQLDILIKLNYFEKYGNVGYLLKVVELYDLLGKKKNFNKEKSIKDGIPEYLLSKYCEKETKATFTNVDTISVLKEMLKTVEYEKVGKLQLMIYESEYLGYIQTTFPDINPKYYFITDIKNLGSGGNKMFYLYQLQTGNVLSIKVRKGYFKNNPVKENDVINVLTISNDFTWRKDENDKWYRTNQREQILSKYIRLGGER